VTIAILTLRGRAEWAHDFNPDRIATSFQALPGASFVVNGAAQFSNVTRSYAGKGVARYRW
jgi:uncharacterized protein with beta-barrel porin domain